MNKRDPLRTFSNTLSQICLDVLQSYTKVLWLHRSIILNFLEWLTLLRYSEFLLLCDFDVADITNCYGAVFILLITLLFITNDLVIH
jgi:hypothetical protein